MYFGLTVIAVAVIAAVCFVAYLLFCRFVVIKTGTTDGLRDVATAMRAYRVPLPSRKTADPTRK
ncbi:MAG: hypothetical protein QOH75_2874 [Actinomycetota bacterium]|jgi:hypothetical protein|nr:hypothetical protein [Actinomycetota bacterium]